MNQKLKIFQMITTKILSISPRNLSELKEFIKWSKIAILSSKMDKKAIFIPKVSLHRFRH